MIIKLIQIGRKNIIVGKNINHWFSGLLIQETWCILQDLFTENTLVQKEHLKGLSFWWTDLMWFCKLYFDLKLASHWEQSTLKVWFEWNLLEWRVRLPRVENFFLHNKQNRSLSECSSVETVESVLRLLLVEVKRQLIFSKFSFNSVFWFFKL